MKISLLQVQRASVLFCVLWYGITAKAAESGLTTQTLTLAQALELASSRSPGIALLAPEAEALETRMEREALPPAFTIETDFENFAGTGNVSALSSLESTVRLSRVIELGNKPSLRRSLGDAEIHRLAGEQQLRRSALAAEVARRFIHVVSDQESLVAARHAIELARSSRDVMRERVDAGASSPAMLNRAQIALARAEIALEHAEHELASSRVKLAVLWGDQQAAFTMALGRLFDLPALEPLEVYQSRLDASPDLNRFASEAKVQDARIRLAEARRSPDVAVAAGVRRLEAFDDQALVASFSVPLGTRRRADLERRAAQADRHRVELDRDARRLELHSTLFDLYQELLHARTEVELLNRQIRPQAAAMLQTTDEGYRAGRFSLLEIRDAQTEMLEIERDAIGAAAEFHTLFVEIQNLTGEPIRTLEVESAP
jgi:cobalt-zinc-cadmium efflux system outer membrane protein